MSIDIHDVTKVSDFYNGGLWGNFLFFVGSFWNFVSGYIKNVDTHHQLEIRSNKTIIAKKRLTNLYEINSNLIEMHFANLTINMIIENDKNGTSLYKTIFKVNYYWYLKVSF